jgi:hypothetical protein
MSIKIFYGRINSAMVDITESVTNIFVTDGNLVIPVNDGFRASFFGDPIPGAPKSIFVEQIDGTLTEYDQNTEVIINNFISNSTN